MILRLDVSLSQLSYDKLHMATCFDLLKAKKGKSLCSRRKRSSNINTCIHSINNQHYDLKYITPLFNIQAPTCFGSSLPSSGSFLDPTELLEMQIK
jgi:hypothetical protein